MITRSKDTPGQPTTSKSCVKESNNDAVAGTSQADEQAIAQDESSDGTIPSLNVVQNSDSMAMNHDSLVQSVSQSKMVAESNSDGLDPERTSSLGLPLG